MSIKEMVKLANKIDMRLKRFGEVGDPEPSLSSLRQKAESWRMGEQGIFGTYIPQIDKFISNLSQLSDNDRAKVYKLRRMLPQAHELWQSGRNLDRKIIDEKTGKEYSYQEFEDYLFRTCEVLNGKLDKIDLPSYPINAEENKENLARQRIHSVVEELKLAFQNKDYELIKEIADAVDGVTFYRK